MPPSRRSHPGQGGPSPRYPGSFLLSLREAAMGLKWEVRQIKAGIAHCADAEGHQHLVGLENLYRRARQVERESWPELIADFLGAVASIETDRGLPESLDEVAGHILARLGPPLAMPKEAPVWSQAIAGTNLWINLVVDYPNRMAYVTESLVHSSSQPGSRWLEIALENLQARTSAEIFEEVDEDSGMRLVSAGDSYDSSRSLILERSLGRNEGDGWLVAMPGRDSLFVLPVNATGVANIHVLKVLAEKNYKTAPYPISAEVFWIRNEVWRLVPIHVQGNQITITPPPEMVDILTRLAPRDESSDASEASEN